jgi:hypothetical protein
MADDSPPTATRTTTSKRSYARADVLAVLHSPSTLISLNPLVSSHALLSSTSTSSTYAVTDTIPVLGGMTSTRTTYEATFSPGEKGTLVRAKAAMGVETRSEWKVDDEGRVVEVGELRAPWWAVSFVEGMWSKSHQILMDRLEEQLVAGPAQ